MLAVRNHLKSIRRSDLETDAELLACEIKPENRKFLCLVFYRPPLSGIIALKQCLKRQIRHISHFFLLWVISICPILIGRLGPLSVCAQF